MLKLEQSGGSSSRQAVTDFRKSVIRLFKEQYSHQNNKNKKSNGLSAHRWSLNSNEVAHVLAADQGENPPANIVLNPATEYVRKFTEEVPREKVLLIEDVMDASTSENLGDLKVLKDEIIENVAEQILTQEKSVAVIDDKNKVVGSINPTKIINTVFGGRKNNS